MKPFHYLVLGYTLIWAALGVYLYTMGRRLRRMSRELEELRRRLQDGSGEPPS
jgi:CcmD family protein